MQHSFEISNRELRLRPLEHKDIESLRRWRNNDQINRFLKPIPYITPEMQEKWFDRYLNDPTEITFAIEYIAEEAAELIGSISLSDVEQGQGECGKFMIGNNAYRGKGLGRRSLALCLETAFSKLEFDAVLAHAHPLNYPSFVAFVNEGFQIVGSRPFQGEIEYELKLAKERYYILNEEK